MARIIPTDDQPGAREAATIEFLDRYLSGIDFIYAKPDGSGFERLEGKRAQAWWQRMGILREKYVKGIQELDRTSRDRFGADFARLTEDQQDQVLAELEQPAREAEMDLEQARAVAGFAPRPRWSSSRCWPSTPGRASTPTRSTAATRTRSAGR
jgi:gluconate 2-dehydrogenase gamma chain